MKARGPLVTAFVAALTMAVFSFSVVVPAAEWRGEAAIKQELQSELGMPILDGELWQKMTHDDKIAFIWGFWHAISIERYFQDKYPQLRVENFTAKVVEASRKSPRTADQIVSLVDQYYHAHPDEIRKPVIGVLWDEMFKPNLETGVAGRPLKHR